jgi:guanine deaminase
MIERVIRGPLLVVDDGGVVTFHHDGVLAADQSGVLQFVRPWTGLQNQIPTEMKVEASRGVMLPPLVDIHTHIPQHPIRGRFVEGVPSDAQEGKLLAGLKRNVFPAEARCVDPQYTQPMVRQFLADTLSHGVFGGVTYMTPSAVATEIALSELPASWSVGLVLMNQNCPADLRTDEPSLEEDVRRLANRFGRRLIMTDRFAVAVNSPLRRRASALAERYSLRTQTHLNEQRAEKHFVEQTLYPNAASYTDVYLQDGLLDHQCIVAHCIHMTPTEWEILADHGAVIAHCPTSNLLLGSGVMPLDEVIDREIPYALATDVGASPTVSMLAEMKQFLTVHENKSTHATPAEALYRATTAAAKLAGLSDQCGELAVGRPMSFIEVAANVPPGADADAAILSLLPENVDAPSPSVQRMTIAGKTLFERASV